MKTFQEAETALEPYIALAASMTGKDITVDCTLKLAALAGNPQDDLRVIHVAGTSGKTSTCYYITALLEQAGMKTGLTVSPHIRNIAERVQIHGEPLSEQAFCEYLEKFFEIVERADQKPSYFELMMVFELWVFVREGVDYAVVETGLGGLHDSSNICRREDKLCVITDIGFDHMHILGDSLGEIAAQKAGIIAPGNIAVVYAQDDEIMQQIRATAEMQNAKLRVFQPPRTPDYRERNFALARRAYDALAERDSLSELNDEQLTRAQKTEVPGRLAVQQRGSATIVIDGAHNEQKVHALITTLRHQYPGQKFAVVLAMKQGKEYQNVITQLATITSSAITSVFTLSQDTPITAIDADVLAEEYRKHQIDATTASTVAEALDMHVAAGEELILVTGSLYAASELLQ